MAEKDYTYEAFREGRLFKWALVTSLAGHLLLLGGILFSPQLHSEPAFLPGVIDVRMVDLNEIPEAGKAGKPKTKSEKAEVVVKKSEPKPKPEVSEEKPAEMKIKEKETAKAEISIAKKEPKAKVSMKYKTIKPKRVIRDALKEIEKNVETAPPKPLSETIKRLREKVEKEEEGKGGSGLDVPTDAKGATTGVFARGSKQENEAIDLYRLEIAYEIKKHWAYSEQLGGTGRNMYAVLSFKVLPDGKITDIFFLDRSGNDYLDDSAYKAIVKSSPVKPHPQGLKMPYVDLGLRFTPEGVQ